jgi:NAD(P)-dependent dehydrogenase (short-subunit alcohol dehydrogenase family)
MTTPLSDAEFGGLVALVTGAASGIGAAIASLLAQRGATVAGLDLHPDQVAPPAHGFACDVRDDSIVRAAVDEVVSRLGRLDIVVNCAGIGAQGTVETATDEEWQTVLDVNVIGTARVSRAALTHLRRSPSAAIVNVCSIVATAGLPQRAVYSASKGAVLALTRAMAADHLHEGVRVNCVNPGTADTPWVSRLLSAAADPAAERAALDARQPSGRLVSAEEVAHAVAYLASPLAGATTATALEVDGGLAGVRLRPGATEIRQPAGS